MNGSKRDELIEKVHKLLALAESENPHEAGAAAARAQAIMEKHDLEEALLGTAGEPEEAIGDHHLEETGRRIVRWRVRLASVLASHLGCKGYYRGNAIRLVGRPSRVARVRQLYHFCVAEIERLAAVELRRRRRQGRASNRSYGTAYRYGAVSAIAEAMRAERERTHAEARERYGAAATSRALEKVDDAKAAEAWAQANLRLRSSGRTYLRGDGLAAGRRDGAGIYGRAARGGLGAGQRRLPAGRR